ncbi:TPA: hypothetical protein IU069_002401 [Enterococcus faecalis]|nr:hypothetical protein [Enterococcus faecalis]
MKKILGLFLSLIMVICLTSNAFAAENDTKDLVYGNASVVEEASSMLDDLTNTQEFVVSEKEIVSQMLSEKTKTREDLNEELGELSKQNLSELTKKGYNESQIEKIKNYEIGEDAFNYLFSDENYSLRSNGAHVTFRYGLAGANTRRNITIAYDMKWSSCPFFTFTDSFGIGWIAADSNSYEIVTKTDSSMAQVNYYTVSGNNAGLYRNVTMDTSENGVVVGAPIIGSANGHYGKHIGGITKISTQSNSYNIDTIHLFVAYAHTTIAVSLDWDVMLEWNKVSGAINFIPRPRQDIISQGDHTFRYNSQGDIVADVL